MGKPRMGAYQQYGKRLIDMAVAGLGLLCLSPLLAVLAVLVRSQLASPVFFRQLRPGYLGRPFTLVKFRTMCELRNENGEFLPDAQRLRGFGRFLRGSSLDELPELWNVLRGEMSLVGPRPLLMQYLPRYTAEQARRHEVRPGITGWAQVNGRNALTWEQKFQLDVWYVDHVNLWLDAKIIALTLKKIIIREGISQPGQATAEEFMGAGDVPTEHVKG